jgi:zinc protease
VVMEERRLRTEDQPQALLFEQLMATALQAHPYRVPVIGWMNDLENMTATLTRAPGTSSWYVPNNAYVVVVGDVDHEAVFELAEQHYGSAAGACRCRTRKPQDEPAQTGIRRLTVKAPADLPVVMMAYKVPVIRDVAQDIDPLTRWKCCRQFSPAMKRRALPRT